MYAGTILILAMLHEVFSNSREHCEKETDPRKFQPVKQQFGFHNGPCFIVS